MKVIGLTGPSGSGKGVCDIHFQSLGIPYIDTDKVYHDLLLPPSRCADELIARFGQKILTNHQTIDRQKLANIVFSDPTGQAIKDLNRISHKYVKEKTLSMLDTFRSSQQNAVVIDAPLLFEADFDKFCDFTIAVLAKQDLRLQRIMERDSLSHEKAISRLQAQKPDEYYSSRANYVLYNNQECDDLLQHLVEILKRENVSTDT